MNMPAGDSSLNFNLHKREPLFIVISGLSGVGKDAVIEELLKRGIPLHKVVTATTRAPRPTERDGVDYYFLSHERFQEMIRNNEFIEWALVYNDYKGVPRKQIRDAMASTEGYQAVTGTISMDENGDAIKDAVILEVGDGAFQYLTTVSP